MDQDLSSFRIEITLGPNPVYKLHAGHSAAERDDPQQAYSITVAARQAIIEALLARLYWAVHNPFPSVKVTTDGGKGITAVP